MIRASITDSALLAETLPETVAEIGTRRPVTVLTQDAIQVILRHTTKRTHIQARAGNVILGASGINRVRWELDENWHHLQTMKSNYDTGL